MASNKQSDSNGNSTNYSLGKRKKPHSKKASYLGKWLDKTMQHIQEASPSMDTYVTMTNPNLNWPNAQYAAGFDPYRFNLYGCTPEPMSLPTIPTYYNPASFGAIPSEYRYIQSENKGIQVQRPRQRRRSENKAEEIHSTPLATPNGTMKTNFIQNKLTDSQEFSSLPPIITSAGDNTSNSDLNTNEKDDGSNNNRCFSDPCVQGLPDVARGANGDADSGSESGSSDSKVGSRLLACLLDQITSLKLANEKLNKELHQTKVELNTVRQQNAIWQKSSACSLGVSSNHSPLNNNGGGYTPGVVTDVVREIRDAARLREEAMYTRLRAMLHERHDNGLTNDTKNADRSLDDIKSSLRASEADKRTMFQRINKLENELRSLRIANGLDSSQNGECHGPSNNNNGGVCSGGGGGSGSGSGSGEEGDELMRARKELAELRRAKQQADEHSHKLEVLVTQLRSKFKSPITTNGPESLPSDPELDPNARLRRTSINSGNSTVVFGPVTDL